MVGIPKGYKYKVGDRVIIKDRRIRKEYVGIPGMIIGLWKGHPYPYDVLFEGGFEECFKEGVLKKL